ncbi:ABC transporter permease [Pectobacterium sp. CHL-2024]|uniref:ABC transporter permease n=1 Tax=Pectobacterium TaxID=122277 RepID=UPI002A81AE10|nr:iron ABC transporter permease [Pectobacterium brasiliense]MDY4350311.1 iron ABC transporter permease [Pectobacterium brasiliense]
MNKFALLPLFTVAVLFTLVGIPVLFVALQAIFPNLGAGSFSNPFSAFADVFAQARLFALLKNTLLLGLGVALCCAVIAIPLGALRGLFALPLARFWDLLFLIPFLIPPYIAGLSWMLALQPRGYAEQLLPIQLGEVLFSLPGMIGVMTLNIFPVVYFAVSRSMAASGNRLADVARVHGASGWQAFLRVTLPLSLPATAASLLLAFTLAIEEYGIPAALGSRAGIQVLTTNIEQRLADWPIDLSGSAVLSLLLVAIALCAFTLQRAIVAGNNVETTTGKPAAIVTRPLGVWRWPVLVLFSTVGLLAVGIPLASMLITAFSATISSAISWQNLTWQHFTMLADYENDALPALTTSLGLAVGSALLTGAVGFLASWFVVAKRIRGAAVLDGLSMLPAALPGIVVGVGLILAWNQSFWPITPYNTWVILLLSYSCLLLPYPVRYSSAALAQIGSNLESAARVHGASAMAALRLIVFPLVFPSLLAAMMLVFAVASRELVTSLLLSPAGVQTVSIFVWRQFEQGSVGDGMAMASVAVLISLSVMLLALRFHALKTK